MRNSPRPSQARHLFALSIALGGALALAACGSAGPTTSHGGAARDHVSFVDNLRGRGLTVDPTGTVQQPFLHAQSGTVLKLSDGGLPSPAEVQSYDYTSASVAQSDLAAIDSHGNPRGSSVSWIGPPHFFAREKVVVVYVGSDPALLKILREVLGGQVAGR
jgi:hypothetical protein